MSHNNKSGFSGFTLIEILLAITIFSMVVAVMFSSFRVGIGSWEKGERGIEFYQTLRAVSEILHREISATYPYLLTPGDLDTHVKFFAFFGSGESLKFVSCSNLHRGTNGLALLELWVHESKGLMIGEAPALASNLSDLDAVSLRQEDYSTVLSPAVRRIEFRYFDRKKGEDDGEWLEQWDPQDKNFRLPLFVEIILTLVNDRDEELKERLMVPIMSKVVLS